MTAQPTEHEGRLSKASKSSKAGAASRATAADKASAATGAPHMAPLLGERVQDILNGIDPTYVMETEAEEQVLQLADDFLDKVIRQSLRLAQHRGSKALDVQDVQLVLAKHWGIVVPGLGLPNIRPLRPGKQSVTKTTSSGGPPANKRKSATDSSAPANRKKPNTGMSPMPQQMQMS
jgi:transcription initiation factor TFIID subunit TAF12